MSLGVSIENDHNVYILGAGFSRAAGLPLMWDFLNTMRDARSWLVERNRKDDADAIEAVLRFRLRAASAAHRVPIDLENIEHLFSLGAAMPDAGLDAALAVSISATLEYARENGAPPRLIVKHQGGPPPSLPTGWTTKSKAERPEQYEELESPAYDWMVGLMCGFFTKRPAMRNTIITFNYDTLVEDSLTRLGLPIGYGFGSGAVNYEWKMTGGTAGSAVQLLKLHGSTNWGWRPGKGRSFTVYRTHADLRAAKAEPVIVAPTWRKVFDEDQLAYVWKEAIAAVETATRLVMVGFSIPRTDLHFKYLLAAGLMANVSLRKVVVVDPRANEPEMDANIREVFRSDVTSVRRAQRAGAYLCSLDAREDLARPVDVPWYRAAGSPDGL